MGKRHAVFQVTFLAGIAPGKKRVQAEEIILGRVDGCDLVVDHKDVSRKHLSVKMAYGQVVIEDLGSSNGTYVNGNEIKPKTPTVVGPTDVIALGRNIQISIECDLSDVVPPPTRESAPVEDGPTTIRRMKAEAAAAKPTSRSSVPPTTISVSSADSSSSQISAQRFSDEPDTPPAKSHFQPIPDLHERKKSSPPPAPTPESEQPRQQTRTFEKPVRTETIAPKLEIETPKFDYNAPLPKALKQNERLYQEVLEARNEAKRLITNAQKQAASIVQEAERLGEVKTQGFYDRARRTEAEANELYKTRTEEAHRDAAQIFENAREEAQNLIAEARAKAQEVRDQAEQFTSELQAETHKKMLDLLRSGEAQARELAAKRAREADEYLQRREKELVEEILANLKDECDERRAQVGRELERLEQEATARIAISETRNKQLVQEGLDAKLKSEEVKKELDRVTKELDQRRRDVGRANNELQLHKAELEEVMVKLEESRLETSRLRSDFAGLKASLDRALNESRRELEEWTQEKEQRQARWLSENEAKRREWLDTNEKEIEEITTRLAAAKAESDRERSEWLTAKQKERAEFLASYEKERSQVKTAWDKERTEWKAMQEKERADWFATQEKEKDDWFAVRERAQAQWLIDNDKKQRETLAYNEKQIAETSLRVATLSKEVEKLTFDKSRLVAQVDEAKADVEAKVLAIREKFADEKARIEKQEQERFDTMKLETLRNVQKLEQDLMLDIQANKVRLAREIMLVMETALSNKLPASAIVELQDFLQDQIVQVLHSPTSVAAGANSKTQTSLGKTRLKNQFKHMVSGAGLGASLVIAAYFGHQYVNGNLKPVDRMVASAVSAREADLAKRKFDPAQVDEIKDSYTDSVIYTRGFVSKYLDSDYQIAYSKALAYHMLKTFSLEEDKTYQAVARIAALVKTLSERKEKIHPDFVAKGLNQMRELEATTLREITQDLGSKVRLEALQKFEREYFQNH